MTIRFEILRRRSAEDKPYLQTVTLEDTGALTVAQALDEINEKILPGDPVRWECSCRQKKCGACAMVINGRPRLACDAWLKEFEKGVVRLEPLKKFPPVCDLIVDRRVLFDDLNKLGAWLEGEASAEDTYTAGEASRCLQCGCCLEVCPNFYAGGKFFGMAGMAPAARLIAEAPEDDKKRLYGSYNEHFYRGCGKSLACRDICPAGLDAEHLIVNSNAAAVWKRRFRKK